MLNDPSRQNNLQHKNTISHKNPKHWGLFLVFAIILGLLIGCADHSAENKALLSQNYQTLSDDDLTLYYYKLKDQIKVVEQDQNHSSISLGFGLGSYGASGGRSGGASVTTSGGHTDAATNLRDRRNEVKLEMKKRDLKP